MTTMMPFRFLTSLTPQRRGGMGLVALLMWVTLMSATPAHAHGGEDHGDDAHAEAMLPPGLLPRAATRTDEVELVAVLEAARLLVYLDHGATNAPLAGARVEVEGLGRAATAAEVEPGVYALPLARSPAPGHHPLAVTVQAGDVEDLLTAELDVPEPVSTEVDHDVLHDHLPAWTWVVTGSVLGALAAWGLGAAWRRRRASRSLAV